MSTGMKNLSVSLFFSRRVVDTRLWPYFEHRNWQISPKSNLAVHFRPRRRLSQQLLSRRRFRVSERPVKRRKEAVSNRLDRRSKVECISPLLAAEPSKRRGECCEARLLEAFALLGALEIGVWEWNNIKGVRNFLTVKEFWAVKRFRRVKNLNGV